MASLFEEKKAKLTALDLANKALNDERAAAGEAEEEVDEGIKGEKSRGVVGAVVQCLIGVQAGLRRAPLRG